MLSSKNVKQASLEEFLVIAIRTRLESPRLVLVAFLF